MAATISALHAKVILNTKGFRTGVQKARKMVVNFTKRIGAAGVRVAKYGAALAGVAAGGLAAIVAKHSQAIDATTKFADRIGIATEQLTGLQHAAELTGVSQNALNLGLQRMTRRVAEAAQGTGAAADAIRTLGLDAQQLAAMSPDQQFKTIADAMQNVEGQSEKVRVAFKIFDSEGVGLINTMKGGAEAIEAAQREANKLGKTFNRVDAAKVEASNDAVSRLKGLIAGAGQTLTVQLVPFIEAAATKLVNMGTDGQSMSDRIISGVEWVVTAIAKLADFMELPKAAFFGFQGVVAKVMQGAIFLVRKLVQAIKFIGEIFGTVDDEATGFLDNLETAVDEQAAKAFEKAGKSMEKFNNSANAKAVQTKFEKIKQSAADSAEQIAKDAEAKKQSAEQTAAMVDDLAAQAEAQDQVTGKLAELQKELDRVGSSEIEVKLMDLEELGATNEQLERARGLMEKIKAAKAEADRRENVADTLEDLDRRVRTFGLSEREKTLLELEALGATEKQLERARQRFEELERLAKEKEDRESEPAGPSGPSSFVVAGSAEAQRLAFRGGRAQESDVPKRQLETQQRMAETMNTIARNTDPRNRRDDEWEL